MRQSLAFVDAITTEYLPAEQLEHKPAPAVLLNVPAGHCSHSTPSSIAVKPALQRHWVAYALPFCESVLFGHAEHADPFTAAGIGEYLPRSQIEQLDGPLEFLKVPGAQARHRLVFRPEYPGPQRQ